MKKYNCPHCNAELYWNAEANALKCEYCEKEFQPEELDAFMAKSAAVKGVDLNKKTSGGDGEKQVREANEQDRVSDDSEKTDLADLVVYACKNCGAEVITSKSTVATTCAFCGRAIALTDKMVGNFKPDSVIPFAVNDDKAKAIYKAYTRKGLLTPGNFNDKNEIKKFKGVYIPFWLHSYDENASVIVHAENQSSHKRGDDKIIEHHMYDIDMDVSGSFASVPADGLKNLDDALMQAIEPFDYSKLTEFNSAYMAGYYAEEYDYSAEESIHDAYERTAATMKDKAVENAGFYTEKVVGTYTPSYSNEVSKYAMLPVWLVNVVYKGKDYKFAVNGETGKIAGSLPISKAKVASIAAGSFVLTQLVSLAIRLFLY